MLHISICDDEIVAVENDEENRGEKYWNKSNYWQM